MSILTDINYRHSAGKLNKFRNDMQGFVAEQIFNIKSKANDKMKRGNVTEEVARLKIEKILVGLFFVQETWQKN